MEIPLVLRQLRDGRLSYDMPLWYRLVMAAVVAVIVTALAVGGTPPSIGGWIVLAIVLFAALYEERWIFDAKLGCMTHRSGLLVAARRTVVEFGSIERFRIVPFVRGTIPGSEDELAANAAALAGRYPSDGSRRRAAFKKPYLRLVCEYADGSSRFLDTVDAMRGGAILKNNAARIASYCGKELVSG